LISSGPIFISLRRGAETSGGKKMTNLKCKSCKVSMYPHSKTDIDTQDDEMPEYCRGCAGHVIGMRDFAEGCVSTNESHDPGEWSFS
jgi:ribosomal protein L33